MGAFFYVRTYQYSHDAILALMQLDIKGDRWPVRKSAQAPKKKGFHLRIDGQSSFAPPLKLQSPHMIDDLWEL